jgi:hypothetical protein
MDGLARESAAAEALAFERLIAVRPRAITLLAS